MAKISLELAAIFESLGHPTRLQRPYFPPDKPGNSPVNRRRPSTASLSLKRRGIRIALGGSRREGEEGEKGHPSQALRLDSNFISAASRAQQHSGMASTTESSSTALHGGLSHSGCSSSTATHNGLQVLLGDSQIHSGPWPLSQRLHSSSLVLNERALHGELSHRGCSSSAAPTFTAARDSLAAPDLPWRLHTAATSPSSHSGSQPISLSAEPSERPSSSPVSSPSRPLITFSSSYTLVRPREGSAKLTFLPTSTSFFSSSSRSSLLAAISRRSKTPTSYHLFSFQPFITMPAPLPLSLSALAQGHSSPKRDSCG